VGDAAMATPTLARVRRELPGACIGALARPGIDQLLAGLPFVDEFHVERASGVMGPKFVAAKLRPRRYDTALLLTNSFSTALITRIAGIPRRVGYDRDARGLLLTDRIAPPKKGLFTFDITPACTYYWRAADALLGVAPSWPPPGPAQTNDVFAQPLPPGEVLSLATTESDERAGDAILARLARHAEQPPPRFALLNPGGNNPAKRWPADRFAHLAAHLARAHNLAIVINGSPAEADLCAQIGAQARALAPDLSCLELPKAGVTLGSLKAIVRRAAVMVTNDTGPRHIAAAFGVPLVSLFGPTDHRWTAIPTHPHAPEHVLVADPTLPPTESANDHPERCSVERIGLDRVTHACESALSPTA
jgi:heptosyltransferase-2